MGTHVARLASRAARTLTEMRRDATRRGASPVDPTVGLHTTVLGIAEDVREISAYPNSVGLAKRACVHQMVEPVRAKIPARTRAAIRPDVNHTVPQRTTRVNTVREKRWRVVL